MEIALGDEVHSDFGYGPVVALTEEWVIHQNRSGDEVAVPYEDVWIPAEQPDEVPQGGKEVADAESN